MKRRRQHRHERVCSCRPDGRLARLESRLLKRVVEREMRCVGSAADARQKAMKGLRAGQLCLESGHRWWAIRVWRATLRQVVACNWQWEPVGISRRYFGSLDATVAHAEARLLGRRIDEQWRLLGHPELATAEREAIGEFRQLWLAKYQEPYWTEWWWNGDD